MKKRILFGVAVVAFLFTVGAVILMPASSEARPSCQSTCEKKQAKCLRQGNDPAFCYDLVFCECMCNVCDDCIC